MSPGPLLVTGFEPFGGEPINPAWEVVRGLESSPPESGSVPLVIAQLPCNQASYVAAVDQVVARHEPSAVIAVGQATGRARIALEARAVNRMRYGDAVDNGGHRDVDEALVEGGPTERPATLPAEPLASELAALGHAVEVSQDAGRFLCNAVLFHLLHRHAATPALFVHLPLMPEQAERRALGEASLPLEDSDAAVRALVSLVARHVAHGLDARR